jgi:hypothetical protein
LLSWQQQASWSSSFAKDQSNVTALSQTNEVQAITMLRPGVRHKARTRNTL